VARDFWAIDRDVPEHEAGAAEAGHGVDEGVWVGRDDVSSCSYCSERQPRASVTRRCEQSRVRCYDAGGRRRGRQMAFRFAARGDRAAALAAHLSALQACFREGKERRTHCFRHRR
jgi:hypothetical protein